MIEDQEIRKNLQEFSKHIMGVARMIGSARPDVDKLIAARECLKTGVKTLDNYIKLEKERLNGLS